MIEAVWCMSQWLSALSVSHRFPLWHWLAWCHVGNELQHAVLFGPHLMLRNNQLGSPMYHEEIIGFLFPSLQLKNVICFDSSCTCLPSCDFCIVSSAIQTVTAVYVQRNMSCPTPGTYDKLMLINGPLWSLIFMDLVILCNSFFQWCSFDQVYGHTLGW